MTKRSKPSSGRSKRPLNYASYNQPMASRKRTTLDQRSDSNRGLSLRLKLKMFIVALLVLGIGGHVVWSDHVSAETLARHQAQIAAAAEAKRKAGIFTSQINALLTANPNDNISVATVSATDGSKTYGDNTVFDGASTAKLLTAADFLHHVENGSTSLNQQIDGQTASYWLKIMLVNSDDTAWSELNGYLTHDDLAAYASGIGFDDYNPANNTFTADDTALLLQKLYAGTLLNANDRSVFLKYLGEANYRQYIVAAVPASDNTYHKVGIDGDTINDAALITHGQKYLVLVIFSDGNGSYDWPARTSLIHAITQDAVAAYL